MQRGSASTTHQYDGAGNRTLLIDSDGGLTTYSYDAHDRIIGIVNPYNEITTMGYDALDRESVRTLANGMTVSHAYDPVGRETVLSALGPPGVALSWYTANYDAVGNRTGVLELDGSEASYGYDPTDQLTNEQRTGANAYDTTYAYDPVGNRLTKNDGGQITTCSYNAGNEMTLLTPPSGAPTTSTYDANGNFLTENAGGALTTYSWDYENRLIGVSSPSGVERYSYSADGMREEKENSAGTVHYVRDGENVLIETDANLITQAHYTDFPGMWGGLASERRGGVSSFYGFDQQANTRILVSPAGAVTDGYLYKAFGEEVAVSGTTVNSLIFGGQVDYWRYEAERLYVRRRILRVDQGRWMSRDPLGKNLYVNLDYYSFYSYSSNNPVAFLDPAGLYPPCNKQTVQYIVKPQGGICNDGNIIAPMTRAILTRINSNWCSGDIHIGNVSAVVDMDLKLPRITALAGYGPIPCSIRGLRLHCATTKDFPQTNHVVGIPPHLKPVPCPHLEKCTGGPHHIKKKITLEYTQRSKTEIPYIHVKGMAYIQGTYYICEKQHACSDKNSMNEVI